MEFIEKIDLMITDMERELKRVRRARTKPDEHAQFVTQGINEIIKNQSKREANEPVKILGHALAKVGELIDKSFERLNTIEGNIIVTIQAYQRIKENLVAHENEKKQIAQTATPDPPQAQELPSTVRKLGDKPKNKIAKRKKKESPPKEKPSRRKVQKKKKTTKTKEE